MRKEQLLLEQIRSVLSSHYPDRETTPLLQVPGAYISTRDFLNEQSKAAAIKTHDNPPAERVQLSSLEDSAMIPDREVIETTRTIPFFSQQDHGQARMKTSVRARCRIWLEARLSDGPVPLATVLHEAKTLGYSAKAIRLARGHLNVRPLACLTLTCEEE